MELGERLEQAIAAASGRGLRLDLGRPSPEYLDYQPHTGPPRRRTLGEDAQGKPVTIPGVLSAEGRQTRAGGRHGWTHEQLAFAAAGMPQLQLWAVLWCLGMDPLVRPSLRAELLIHALELKELERWPLRVRRAECPLTGQQRCQTRYVLDLCTLALWEGAEPQRYGTEVARATWFGLTDRHWRRSGVARGYQGIVDRLSGWYSGGIGYLRGRLRPQLDG